MNHLHLKHLISMGTTLLGVGLALLGSMSSEVCMWIGIGLMLVGTIIRITMRCPKCGHNLIYRRWSLPKFCPECGHPIGDGEFEGQPHE